MNKIKVAFYTLGCKLNFSESSTISKNIIDSTNNNYEKVDFKKFANIYIINTCSVTSNADKKFKYIVKKSLKNNPNAFIIAIGCYAQLNPNELSKTYGVDLVLGAKEKFKILDYIQDISKKKITKIHSSKIEEMNFYTPSYSIGDDRTRSFLKIQDGCDYKCTYCTIPLARGKSRSDNIENILNNAKNIANKGVKEIVLTGVNIGDYGKESNNKNKKKYNFFDLIKSLEYIDIKRIRISSIEPNLLNYSIIKFISSSNKFAPHFHIPLQSGDDEILKKMKRRYLTSFYKKKINQIHENIPNACIGIDVIVGFPGETHEQFIKTYNFINDLEISYIHVFTYSERINTEASNMKKVIPINIRNNRNKMLRILSLKKRMNFYRKQMNTYHKVLFEKENKMGFIHGYTENYVRVKSIWNKNLINKLILVKTTDIDYDSIMKCNIIEK